MAGMKTNLYFSGNKTFAEKPLIFPKQLIFLIEILPEFKS